MTDSYFEDADELEDDSPCVRLVGFENVPESGLYALAFTLAVHYPGPPNPRSPIAVRFAA